MRLFLFALLLLTVPQGALAQDTHEPGFSIYSREVFRGLTRYQGAWLRGRYEVERRLSKKSDLVGNALVGAPLQGDREGHEFSEYRLSGYYRIRPGAGDAIVGGTWYQYAGERPPPGSTGEIFGILAFSAILNPSFALYQDVDETYSRYFEMEFHEELPTDYYDRDVVFEPFARFGYGFATKDPVYSQSGLNHIDLGLRAESEFGGFGLNIEVAYTASSDERVRHGIWGGLGVRYRF